MVNWFFSLFLLGVVGLWALLVTFAALWGYYGEGGSGAQALVSIVIGGLLFIGAAILAAKIRGESWFRAIGHAVVAVVGLVVLGAALLFLIQKNFERRTAAGQFDGTQCQTEFGKQPHTQWYLDHC